jgi:antitoxin HicB
MTKKQNPAGQSIDAFLDEQSLRGDVDSAATKRVLAWQLEQARKRIRLSKKDLASAMNTSRTQVERVLDPTNVAVSLDTLERAAGALGMKLKIELVESRA